MATTKRSTAMERLYPRARIRFALTDPTTRGTVEAALGRYDLEMEPAEDGRIIGTVLREVGRPLVHGILENLHDAGAITGAA